MGAVAEAGAVEAVAAGATDVFGSAAVTQGCVDERPGIGVDGHQNPVFGIRTFGQRPIARVGTKLASFPLGRAAAMADFSVRPVSVALSRNVAATLADKPDSSRCSSS